MGTRQKSVSLSNRSRIGQNGVPRLARRPFWAGALRYYFLSFAIAFTLFFVVWALLFDSGESAPYLPAGMIAGLFLIAAVVLREILLGRARRERFEAQLRLEENLRAVSSMSGAKRAKLSIRRNDAMLEKIFKFSEASRALNGAPDGHWETFVLCDSYLRMTKDEIERTSLNSPRLPAINKGRRKVKRLHRHHLIQWARTKSGQLMTTASSVERGFADRIGATESAAESLKRALEFYPREKELQDSLEAVGEFGASLRISHKLEQANRASQRGDRKRAYSIYRDALQTLQRESLSKQDKNLIAESIHAELLKLQNHAD